MEWIQILTQIQQTLDINATDMAKQMGERVDRFYQFKTRGVKPQFDFLQKMLEIYPQLSAEFLLTGQGDVLKSEPVAPASDESDKDIIIRVLTKQIRELEASQVSNKN